MGADRWEAVKVAMRGHDVKGFLFDIPLDRPSGQPLRLREFKLEAATPYVYDRFIGAWGMFPHHEQVPLYFAKHIYVEFVLGMRPDYTSTPSAFFGAGRGRSYQRPRAQRDPGYVPPPPRLVSIPERMVIRAEDTAQPSQLGSETSHVLAGSLRTTMTGAIVAAQAESSRPHGAPLEPAIWCLDDDTIDYFDVEGVRKYAKSARDAYFRLYDRFTTTPQVCIYFISILYACTLTSYIIIIYICRKF